MKNTRKILSIIFAILMVISIIPITASAATKSGTCGDDLTWTYDSSTYTLTISGTGNMYDYKSNNRPWGSYEDSIKVVVVEDGVTSIGTRAFYHCEKLITVTLPDSITLIGEYAFRECKKLKNINIPNNVKEINPHTFTFCESITNITIPNSVTIIGESAFYACYGLTEITVPDNVISISESAFESCRNLKNLIIGSGVETIGKWAFANCDSLAEVTIPANVTTIEDIAFSYCESLEKITVDSNNKYYSNDDYGALFDKDKTTLIQYPLGSAQTSYTIPDGTTTILDYAFEYALNLESVIIPESVTVLGKYVFRNNNDGFALYYKGTQAQWDELLANNSETSKYLKNYTVNCIDNTIYPSGACGDNLIWTFNAHTSTLTISGTGSMYDYEIDYMSGFINQPWRDFSRNIKHIVVEDGVTSIGEAAFTSCDATDITIGDSVASIGSEALDYCDELTTIIVDEDNPYYSNDEFGVLFNKDKTTLLYYPLGSQRESYTIPDGVTTIKEYTFNHCGDVLKSVTVPKSVITIGESAFSYSYFNSFYIYYLGTETEWNAINGSSDVSYWIIIYFAEQEHKHNYESVVTAPNCTAQGYTTYTCECGDSYVGNYVDELGHNHTSKITTPATHTTTGVMTYTCACGDSYTETIEKIEKHDYESAVTAPTCTEQGYTTYTCECGDSYVDDYVDATGHSYTSEITTPATHTTTGVMTYTCTCGNSYTEIIDKLAEHNHNVVVTPPTCTEQGYTTYTCECGDSYVDNYVNALGHTEETFPAVAPTCTETGLTEGLKCSVCGEILTEQETVDALGHTPSTAVEENYVAPTCTENGNKDIVVYCSVCDEELSRTSETVEMLGHADNDGDGCCDSCDEQLCDHRCHKNGFFWKILRFVNRIFGTNKYCQCGVAHY